MNDVYRESQRDIGLVNLMDQLNINGETCLKTIVKPQSIGWDLSDNYSINKTDFKKSVLPLVQSSSPTADARAQANALQLIQRILFHDLSLGKSKLSESALKAGLISKLISINETTNKLEIQESICNFYLLLCFIIADNNKRVKKLLLSNDNLVIDSTIK